MKLRHLLSASLLCWAGMAGARDVHGVNGYYNWTTAQMQTSANLSRRPVVIPVHAVNVARSGHSGPTEQRRTE